jgi:hypothetical protein
MQSAEWKFGKPPANLSVFRADIERIHIRNLLMVNPPGLAVEPSARAMLK